jgi:hypothetical protein
MGKMNLLKAKWDGKVGQTVGAKWKNLATIRTYAKPSNPNTSAQQTIRTGFKQVTSFVALFSDLIRYQSSLDTRGQSVRNAIISANKTQMVAGTITKADLIVNKGGLPNVTSASLGTPAAGTNLTLTYTKPVATNITAKAKIVAVAVDEENKIAGVGVGPLADETVEIAMAPLAGATVDVYYWVIDYRGSARVGSYSGYLTASV